MNKKYPTIIIILLVVFSSIFSFGRNVFAQAQFQSFSANLAFGNNCANPKVTYSTVITPSTITAGNIFKIGVKLQNASNTSQSVEEVFYTIIIPTNGSVTNGIVNLTQTIIPTGTYLITIYEYQGNTLITTGPVITTTPTNTSGCQTSTANQNSSSLTNQSPGGVSAVSFDIDINNPISVNSIPDLIETVLEALIKIGIPLLVVMIVFSGFMYLFARGDPGKISKAHTMLLYTLIGGAILLGAWALAQLILTTLLEVTAYLPLFFV